MNVEPGWKCQVCYTGNEHGWTTCDNCGADRDGEISLSRRVQDIQAAAKELDMISVEDDIDLDKALGEVAYLISKARDNISAQWKRNREQPHPLFGAADLEELLRDIDQLKPISEAKDE